MTSEEKKTMVDKLTKGILSVEVFAKYMLNHKWLSGSSTEVYPITAWKNYIEIQLTTKARKHYFRKAIADYQQAWSEYIERVYYVKQDGSCPDTIRFVYRTPLYD